MRNAILLAMTLPMVLVGAAFACTVSDAHFSGQFDDSGRFVLQGALDSTGQPLEGAAGIALTSVTAADGVALPASGMVWAMGDLDLDKGTAQVKGFTTSADEAAAVVANLQGGGYAVAGAGCSASKAASCASKNTAATASAGSCASKNTAATASAGSCASKNTAAAASAGSCASKNTAATASAGSCASKNAAATAKTAGADGCCPSGAAASTAAVNTAAVAGAGAVTASAVTAGSKSGCGADCTKPCCAAAASAETADGEQAACKEGCVKPCCAANTYTYTVSNMTCGACVSKVEGAVKAMENSKVAGCWVDLDKGTAVVTSSEGLDAAAIAAAITKAGFPAEQVVVKDEKKAAPADESAATM